MKVKLACLGLSLLLLSAGQSMGAGQAEVAATTVILVSDIPLSRLNQNTKDSITFYDWTRLAFARNGKPFVVVAQPEFIAKEAASRGLHPVVVRNRYGELEHLAFEEDELEKLCKMASDLQVKYIIRVGLAGLSASTEAKTRQKSYGPLALSYRTQETDSEMKVDFTIYDAAKAEVIASRSIEVAAQGFTPSLAGARSGRYVVQSILGDLNSEGLETSATADGEVRINSSRMVSLGPWGGNTYNLPVTLVSAERLGRSILNVKLSFRNETADDMEMRVIPLEGGKPITYLEDPMHARYDVKDVQYGKNVGLRPGERKDLTLVFDAPPQHIDTADLVIECSFRAHAGFQRVELRFSNVRLNRTP
jgi:hypothetical protein